MTTRRQIGERSFVDGVTGPVFEVDHGQYVMADGEQINGVWLLPADDPVSVARVRTS